MKTPPLFLASPDQPHPPDSSSPLSLSPPSPGLASMASLETTEDFLKQGDPKAKVYSFNPTDSPAQKAAQAGQARGQLSSMLTQEEGPTEREVGQGSVPTAANPIPTIVIQDHDGEQPLISKDTPQNVNSVQEEPRVPGSLPSAAPYSIPDWYRVGWRQNCDIDKPPLEGEAKDKDFLSQFVSEQYYGAWYHNAAVIVTAVFATHFLTRFGFGWGWLFIVLAFCSTYYSNSMTKFRRTARDDIQRDLVKVRLGSEHETAEWMNQFLARFWIIYEPILSETIIASVDQILSVYTPTFLDSLRLSTFTLGSKAPRIDQVRTFPNTDDDIVMMDWAFSFTPKDTSDLTQRQAAKLSNPKIILSIHVGKGLASAAIPVLVENFSLSGLMRVRMKLVNNFPHVQVVDLSFMEEPAITYELKPIGGETFGFDIAHIPGLSSFIRETIHSVLRPMMYDPNVFTLNLEQLLSGKPLDTAVGVLQVTITSARGIKGVKIGGGTPDPFISLSISERAELARTKWKSNTYNPTWMETKYILISNLHERLVLDLYDYNEHRSHTKLSSATFELEKLEADSVQEGIISQLLKDGKERGELRYDLAYYPVIEPEQAKDIPESSVGVVRLVVHQAKDLDNSKSMSGELNPMVKIYLNADRKPAYTSRIVKHTNNPVWEAPYEFLCSNKAKEIVTIKIIDDRDFLKDPVVGYMSISLEDLLSSKTAGRDWFPLSSCKTGKIRVSAEWKPVAMAGSLEGADHYVPPIGVVRLWLNKAVDVKNVEAALGGKSDPYVRVQVRNVTKGRTEVINNNLNPVWDQIVYIPVHSLRESLMLECMDYQNLTKDRSLGSVELNVSDLARALNNPRYPFEGTGRREAAEPLRLDKGNATKGTLYFHAEFVPAMKLKDLKFEKGANSLRQRDNSSDEDGGNVSDNASVASDNEAPIELTYKAPKAKPVPIKVHANGNGGTENGVKAVDLAAAEKQPHEHVQEIDHPEKVDSNPGTPVSVAAPPPEGVNMTTEELLAQQSGIIVFNVISGHLAKKGRLEVLMDDAYWPCFSTPKSRSTTAQWDYVGEGFLKEMDFAQVWLRLDQAESEDKDDIAAECRIDAKAFLDTTLNGPYQYTLYDKNGDPSSTVLIESRYIPVPVTLEPRETVNNQGVLRIELLDGQEIRGVDRGGKSDPYAEFFLNGIRCYKSEAKKKTLTPEWNESFEVEVPSRVAADFRLEVFDWNAIEQAKSLGVGQIDLAGLEPFQMSERRVPLATVKHGEKGSIRVRLVFQPRILVKTRKNTSTIIATGRAFTQIGSLPGGAAKGVMNLFQRNKHAEDGLVALANEPVVAQTTGQASKPIGAGNDALTAGYAAFPSTENVFVASSEPGTLRVNVMDAKDLPVPECKPYVTLRLGDREFKTKHHGKTSTPEWNESFTFAASPQTPKLHLWMHDHKTLGKDKDIGEGEVEVWRHIKPEGVSSAEVLVQLRQGGLLRLRLEFDPTLNPSSSRASVSSGEGNPMTRTLSHVSPSRFSLRGKRPTEDD